MSARAASRLVKQSEAREKLQRGQIRRLQASGSRLRAAVVPYARSLREVGEARADGTVSIVLVVDPDDRIRFQHHPGDALGPNPGQVACLLWWLVNWGLLFDPGEVPEVTGEMERCSLCWNLLAYCTCPKDDAT